MDKLVVFICRSVRSSNENENKVHDAENFLQLMNSFVSIYENAKQIKLCHIQNFSSKKAKKNFAYSAWIFSPFSYQFKKMDYLN